MPPWLTRIKGLTNEVIVLMTNVAVNRLAVPDGLLMLKVFCVPVPPSTTAPYVDDVPVLTTSTPLLVRLNVDESVTWPATVPVIVFTAALPTSTNSVDWAALTVNKKNPPPKTTKTDDVVVAL